MDTLVPSRTTYFLSQPWPRFPFLQTHAHAGQLHQYKTQKMEMQETLCLIWFKEQTGGFIQAEREAVEAVFSNIRLPDQWEEMTQTHCHSCPALFYLPSSSCFLFVCSLPCFVSSAYTCCSRMRLLLRLCVTVCPLVSRAQTVTTNHSTIFVSL